MTTTAGRPRRAPLTRLLGAALALASAGPGVGQEAGPLPPSAVEDLGNPFFPGRTDRTYSRNVWDITAFDGRLWFGHGNSSNINVERNAGPVPLITYTPGSGFDDEGIILEEQIDSFRVLDGQLVIPGHDPRGGTGQGSWYRLEGGEVVRRTNIPNVRTNHTYDLIERNGNLYAALGSARPLAVSTDNGASFQSAIPNIGDQRFYHLFEAGDALYASGFVLGNLNGSFGKRILAELNEDSGQFELIDDVSGSIARLFPGYTPGRAFDSEQVRRSVGFQGHTAYLGALGVNDHQSRPFGAYAVLGDFEDSFDLLGGTSQGIPFDLLAIGDEELLVLTGAQRAADDWRIEVLSTTDLESFRSVLSFDAATFARSFELLDGDLYFGLGSFVDDVSPATGGVLRVDGSEFTLSVPEPATAASLLLLGGWIAGRRGRRARD